MGAFVANKVIKLLIKNDKVVKGSTVLVLGITFKENCPDIRNSGVVDIIEEFEQFGTNVSVYDPWVNPKEVKAEYGISVVDKPRGQYSAVILAVGHNKFLEMDIQEFLEPNGVLFDVKSILPKENVTYRL
jgi:UDP-N-acetyl-D-galactosamine dehydrogenase